MMKITSINVLKINKICLVCGKGKSFCNAETKFEEVIIKIIFYRLSHYLLVVFSEFLL